jgi:hypothetical protein
MFRKYRKVVLKDFITTAYSDLVPLDFLLFSQFKEIFYMAKMTRKIWKKRYTNLIYIGTRLFIVYFIVVFYC